MNKTTIEAGPDWGFVDPIGRGPRLLAHVSVVSVVSVVNLCYLHRKARLPAQPTPTAATADFHLARQLH